MPLFKSSSGLCIRQTPVVWHLVPMLDGAMCESAALFLHTSVKAVGFLHVHIDSFSSVVAL